MDYSLSLLELDGEQLSISDVVQVARYGTPVAISQAGKHKLGLARTIIDRLATQNVVTYGINTGFGKLGDVIISPEQTGQLQYNLVTSHAGGVGEPFEEEIVRAILLLRTNTLTKGYSGISADIVETMIKMLNAGVATIGVHDAEQLFKIASISAAITLEALGGITAAFDERLHKVSPH